MSHVRTRQRVTCTSQQTEANSTTHIGPHKTLLASSGAQLRTRMRHSDPLFDPTSYTSTTLPAKQKQKTANRGSESTCTCARVDMWNIGAQTMTLLQGANALNLPHQSPVTLAKHAVPRSVTVGAVIGRSRRHTRCKINFRSLQHLQQIPVDGVADDGTHETGKSHCNRLHSRETTEKSVNIVAFFTDYLIQCKTVTSKSFSECK